MSQKGLSFGSQLLYTISSEVVIIRKVELTMNEQAKYEAIKKLSESGGNKKAVAIKLGCTLRHVNRMLKGYQAQGKAYFSHGNKGRKPASALSEELKENILLLRQNKYHNANHYHFTELLAKHEDIHISEGTVRKLLYDHQILSPEAWKRTRRKLAAELRERKSITKSRKEQIRLQEAILTVECPHPTRERCAFAGEMIQMDASVHKWFGDKQTQLHAAIDDATGMIVGAYFDKQETLNGYYHVFRQILENYGIPYMFYTDRRTVFEYKKKNSSDTEKDTFTQFSYACKQLGVELKTTSVPQAKGRIERLFGTLQSRLPIEMRLAGIQTTEQANEFLNSYIKEFNAQFALPLNTITSVFDAQPDQEKIDLVLSVISTRTIDAGHSIRYNNHKYRLLDRSGIQCDFHKGSKVLVIRTLSGKLFCSLHERIYVLEEILQHEKASRYFSTEKELAEAKKAKPQYIPPMDHPWRKDNFMKHVYAMTGRELSWAS